MKELLRLYFAFFKIGLFTFGGGYAMLPLILREVVEKNGWATEDQVMDYFAIGQCTPGVIAVNTATFIGHKKDGFLGALFATLGVVSPSIVIISAIAALLGSFSENQYLTHALAGIRLAVCALVSVTIFKLFKKGIKDVFGALIAVLSFILLKLLAVSPVICVVLSALIGIVVHTFFKKEGEKK